MIKTLERIRYHIKTFGPTPPETLLEVIQHPKDGMVSFTLWTGLFAGDLKMNGLGEIETPDMPRYEYQPIAVDRVRSR